MKRRVGEVEQVLHDLIEEKSGTRISSLIQFIDTTKAEVRIRTEGRTEKGSAKVAVVYYENLVDILRENLVRIFETTDGRRCKRSIGVESHHCDRCHIARHCTSTRCLAEWQIRK